MVKKRGPSSAAKKRAKPSGRYHHGDLRAALLVAAVEVLRERGVSGLSLRECARRLGVSHAAPYRHFADKEALLGALVGQGFRWLTEAGREAMHEVADPRDRIDAYGVAYVRFAAAHPEHARLMFAGEIKAAAMDADDRAAGEAAFELLRATAAEVVGPEGDDLTAALAYWSLSHGLSMLIIDGRIAADRAGTPEAVAELARDIYTHWRRIG